jgi:hypothetical protein
VGLCRPRRDRRQAGAAPYNGFDTGAFVCTPVVFEAVDRAVGRGDTSLAGGVADLAGVAMTVWAHQVEGQARV